MRNEILQKIVDECLSRSKSLCEENQHLLSEANQLNDIKTQIELIKQVVDNQTEYATCMDKYTKAMAQLYDVKTRVITLSTSKCIPLQPR